MWSSSVNFMSPAGLSALAATIASYTCPPWSELEDPQRRLLPSLNSVWSCSNASVRKPICANQER